MKKEYKTLKATIYLYVPSNSDIGTMTYFAKNPMNGRMIIYGEDGKPISPKSFAGNIYTLFDILFKSWRQRAIKQIKKSKKETKTQGMK
jgi:hypothetical protein